MKNKIKKYGKKIVALLLSVLTVTMMFPISAVAASENLGAVSGMKELDVSVSSHYGHELHTTKKGSTTYPIFCIEYGTTSPSSSYLKGKKAMASDNAIKAAKWIFAGYYLEHGNSIDWQDMAYCQKKVWSIFGSNTSWDFSDSEYKAWCDKAQDRMDNLNKKPSFNNTNVGTIVAGNSLTVTDTNKVLSDYPAFTKNGSGWSITHSKNSNSLTINVDKSCTASSFKLANGEYYKDGTGDDDELLLYYPYGSEAYQKLIYSAYYDPVSMAFSGSITPLSGLKIVKTSEDGVVGNIKFTVTGPNNFSTTVTTNSNGELIVPDLTPGTYTVTEENLAQYVPTQAQSVKVESGKTATVSFSNVLKRGSLTVSKTSEDGLNQGVKFHLYGTSLSGADINEYAVTDNSGVAHFNNIPISSSYTVEEVETAIRYVVPDKQTVAIEWNKVNNIGFNNVLKRGSLTITKTSEDGLNKDIKFHLYGTSLSGIIVDEYAVTDDNGIAHFNNILIGSNYTVEEVDTAFKYIIPDKQFANIEWNKVTNNNFNNVLKRGSLTVTKTCEDGLNEGIKFHLYGTSLSGIAVNEYAVTDNTGVAHFNKILIGSGYTIEEVDTAIRYVIPDNQITAIEWNKVTNNDFNNVLKKFRVTVTKQDYEKGHAQGDAKLSGAVYGLFKGNNLVAQYTTDQSGSFTTDYYVCGTDWTIKEITPSEGYLLNDTVYKVGADPKDYTVEYNNAPDMTVMEQVIKGKISIIKHTDDGETQIETPEKGAEFQVYLKSSGSFVNADKDERDTIVCDEDGFASTKLLPYGVYTVHQTKGWAGRELITDFDVFISTNGKTYKFLINNKNFESYLKVVKLDKETGKRIPYEGAAFEIYDSNNHRITMQYTYPQVTSIHTFYTNKDGYLITPEKLPHGDYTLKEVQAPYGYVLDDTPVPFSITQENSSTDTGVTVVKVKARDVAQKGVINITKTGEIFSSVEENKSLYTPKYSVGNLKGAVFEIYAAEDITTLDGTVRYEQGSLVDTITTDDDGVAKSKELYLGKYTVIEKTAPNGYVHNAAKYDAELIYAGQNVSVTSTAVSVYNDRQKVAVSLKKEMDEDKTFNLGKNNEISFVQFGIYANEDIKASNGDVIPKDALITFANCDKNGNIAFDCDLPIGFKWYVKEIATDKHYILSDTKYEFDTEYQGQNVKVIDIKVNNDKAIENKLIYGSVKGLKVDRETQETIKGATFGLFFVDTTELTEKNAVLTAVTDESGIFTFTNVPYGEYIIKELKPADGYLDNEDIFKVTISTHEQMIELTPINDRTPELKTTATVDGNKEVNATEVFTLTDTVEYKHLVPGKEYVLKGVLMNKATGKALELDGKEITSEVKFTPEQPSGTVDVLFTFDSKFIKTETQIIAFEYLYKDGKELTTHTDIEDEGQTVTVKIPSIKTTAKVNGKKKATAKGKLSITDTVSYENLTPGKEYDVKGILMDKKTGKPFKVKGKEITSTVKFVPDKANGKVEVTFTFDGSAIKKDTDLVVFETLYRDGVELTAHADINDKGQTVTIKVPELENPKTGDERNINKVLGIAGASLVGIAGCVYFFIKRKKKGGTDND